MDNLMFFGGESDYQIEELPWVKDWLKGTRTPDIPQSVHTVNQGDKGLLLTTNVYKSFVFKKEQVYKHLIEALDVWSKEGLPSHPLIIAVLNQKQIRYGINPDGIQVTWSVDGGKYIATPLTAKKPTRSKTPNPFLTPNNPTSTNGSKSKLLPEVTKHDPSSPEVGV